HSVIATIVQTGGPGARAKHRVLELDDIPALRAFFQDGSGPQAGKWADFRPFSDPRALNMAEPANGDIVGHRYAGPEGDIGLDRHVSPDFGVPAEENGFRRSQRIADRHGLFPLEFLTLRFLSPE